MTAARRLDLEFDRDAASKATLGLKAGVSQAVLEALAMATASPGAAETARKWLGHVNALDDPDSLTDLIAEAGGLALELTVYAPSFTGVRIIDRLVRKAGARSADEARGLALLAKAKFALFWIEARVSEGVFRAIDLASEAPFLFLEERLTPQALGMELAARLCPLGDGAHMLVGPIIPLASAGQSAAELVRPGKGLGNDQRCAAIVYRDYIRKGGGAQGFGLERGDDSVSLSLADDELDDLASDWLEFGDGTAPTGDALAQARNLSSATRIVVALSSATELRAAGMDRAADIYRRLAAIQMETMHSRGRVGSGEARPLEAMRAIVAARIAEKRLIAAALDLFDELARPLVGAPKANEHREEDLSRVIERIRAMRAKTTEQGCTEQEALLAAEKVAEMLERYGLTLSEIELRKQVCEGFGVDTGRRKQEPSDRCVPFIANFCDCRAWSEKNSKGDIRFVFFGLPADVEAARALYDLVGVAFATETATFKKGSFYSGTSGAERRAAVASFQIGLANGVGYRLESLKEARRQAKAKSGGRDLVPVKVSIVEEEFAKLGLSLYKKSLRRRRSVVSGAYEAGRAAGRKIEVDAKLA